MRCGPCVIAVDTRKIPNACGLRLPLVLLLTQEAARHPTAHLAAATTPPQQRAAASSLPRQALPAESPTLYLP